MKKTMQKYKNKIIFPLACLVVKIKHLTIFILQKKFFKWHVDLSRYRILKIPIIHFDIFMTN